MRTSSRIKTALYALALLVISTGAFAACPTGWTGFGTCGAAGTAALVNTGTSGGTLGLLNSSKTDSGNNTFSGTNNFTGTFEIGGTALKLGTLTNTDFCTYSTSTGLNCNIGFTGTGSVVLSASPTFTGNPTFSGVPIFSGLSSGTCANGLALDSGNHFIETSCGSGSSAFSALTGGTNTSATMTVGSGAILEPSGTGVVTSTAFNSSSNNGNTCVGTGTCASLGVSENLVTAVGYHALNANTLNGTAESTAVGWSAQANITTGNQNTTVGVNTLGTCQTCIHDILVGTDAMRNPTVGNYNIGIGVTTLINSGDSTDIAIGDSALQGANGGSSTGHDNIAIGWEAMQATGETSASANVVIGDANFSSATSGFANVFIGHNAGLAATADFASTGVGYQALYSENGTGVDTALGYQACKTVTTGIENVCLGTAAGGATLQTGSNNILIGYGADTATGSTSNTIEVNTGGGNILQCTGTNTPSTADCTFSGPLSIASLTDTGITGATQCLHASAAGVVSGTGSDCGGPSLTAGTSISISASQEVAICTSTCTVTPPTPSAGYEFCARNDDDVSTVITLAAVSGVQYEETTWSSYKTADTSLVSGGAVGDGICMMGRDSTHWLVFSYNGTWS